MTESSESTIFITGVSAGLGHALAKHYLDGGSRVFGLSRRTPAEFIDHPSFRFVSADLAAPDGVGPAIQRLVGETPRLDLVVLNAGVLGQLGDLIDADLADLRHTMQVNVWANKLALDAIFRQGLAVGQVVAISSGASVNGNRGWSGYSISKAALNMLIKIYSKERPETHFCSLAPGIIDTAMQEQLRSREPDDRFPSVEALRSKHGTPELPCADDAAPGLAKVMARLPQRVQSGVYIDVRALAMNSP